MTNIEKFHFVADTHKTVVQIARAEKPTGDYPEWVDATTDHFNSLAREYRNGAIQEHGSIHAVEAATRRSNNA